MNKSISSAVMTLMLVMSPLYAEAQFLKKLGKALEKAEKTVGNVLDSETSSNVQKIKTNTDGTKVVNNLKGFTVEYQGVTWQKDFCGVNFIITNNNDKAVQVYQFEKMKTFGSDGTQYASRSIVGNALTSLGNGDFDFEPGVPVKCIYAIFDLPEKGTKMSLCQLRLKTFDNGYNDNFVEFRNVTIPPKPTEASAKPFKGVWKLEGKNLEGKLNLDIYGKSVAGTDAMGNDIKCYGTIYVGYGSGASIQVDECSIISCKGQGNSVSVNFIGGRDGNTYQALMTYNPQNGSISFKDIKIVQEEGMAECFLSEDLVFEK